MELIESGTKIGRYELIQPLAIGGMAQVYLAKARGIEQFERLVVFKRILPSLSKDPQFISMFLDEARLAATLQHPNIAQVYDIGCQDGDYFFVMEYVDGKDVGRIRRQASANKHPIPLPHALKIVMDTATALHSAHERKGPDGTPLHIVHRDVTPSNIILTYEGCVKLIDFGIAKAVGRKTETKTGIRKGKTSHMSPEQCVGDPIDRRSDIFTLGILLFELTTGTRLFKSESEYETMQRIVRGSTPLPSDRVPGYDPALEAIVLRALERDPDDRYQTARQLHLDLDRFVQKNGLHASQYDMASYVRKLFHMKSEETEERTENLRKPQGLRNPVTNHSPRSHAAIRSNSNDLSCDVHHTTPGFTKRGTTQGHPWSTLRDVRVDDILDAEIVDVPAGSATTETGKNPLGATHTNGTIHPLDTDPGSDVTKPDELALFRYEQTMEEAGFDNSAVGSVELLSEEPSIPTNPKRNFSTRPGTLNNTDANDTRDLSKAAKRAIAATIRQPHAIDSADQTRRVHLPLQAPTESQELSKPIAKKRNKIRAIVAYGLLIVLIAIGTWRFAWTKLVDDAHTQRLQPTSSSPADPPPSPAAHVPKPSPNQNTPANTNQNKPTPPPRHRFPILRSSRRNCVCNCLDDPVCSKTIYHGVKLFRQVISPCSLRQKHT